MLSSEEAFESRPLRILVVDDDDVDREKVRRLLRSAGLAFRLDEADSSEVALDLLSRVEFDCVLIDYQIGDLSGTDFVRSAKQSSERLPPMIMVTGLGDERVVVEAMREGIYDYLSKNHLTSQRLVDAIEGGLRWAKMERELESTRARLLRMSLFDGLTNLPNRNLFLERLEQTLQSAKRADLRFSVMMMDLNLFKEVNDTLGHAAGDKVLAEVGRRLGQFSRASDTFARLGGDEFGALLVGCESVPAALAVAERVHAALQEPIAIDEAERVQVTVSIGVAIYPDHGRDSRTLLTHADQAMYRAKRAKRMCEVYTVEHHESRSFLIASQLAGAPARSEFFLEYQPIVHLGTGELASVEALVRWRHQSLGLLPPGEFIPCAERTALIKPITYSILDIALDQAQQWRIQGTATPVSINLSARVFADEALVAQIEEALRRRDLPPELLTLELTEASLMKSPQHARDTLRELRAMGISIAIDDFGAGFTSLKYLREFEISEIKLDPSLTHDVEHNAKNASVVRSMAELCRGFGARLIAEAIEDVRQCALLYELGCEYGQGYAVAHPMPDEQFSSWRALRSSGASLSPASRNDRVPAAEMDRTPTL